MQDVTRLAFWSLYVFSFNVYRFVVNLCQWQIKISNPYLTYWSTQITVILTHSLAHCSGFRAFQTKPTWPTNLTTWACCRIGRRPTFCSVRFAVAQPSSLFLFLSFSCIHLCYVGLAKLHCGATPLSSICDGIIIFFINKFNLPKTQSTAERQRRTLARSLEAISSCPSRSRSSTLSPKSLSARPLLIVGPSDFQLQHPIFTLFTPERNLTLENAKKTTSMIHSNHIYIGIFISGKTRSRSSLEYGTSIRRRTSKRSSLRWTFPSTMASHLLHVSHTWYPTTRIRNSSVCLWQNIRVAISREPRVVS